MGEKGNVWSLDPAQALSFGFQTVLETAAGVKGRPEPGRVSVAPLGRDHHAIGNAIARASINVMFLLVLRTKEIVEP